MSQALDRARLSAQRLSSAVPRTESAGAAAGALYSAAGFCKEASRSLASFSDGCQAFANRLASGGGGGTGGSGGGSSGGPGGGPAADAANGGTKGMNAPAHAFRQEDRVGTDAWAHQAGVHAGDCSPQQQSAVARYSGSDYHRLNEHMRRQGDRTDASTPVDLTDDHRVIDGAMRPLPEDIEVIRGTGRSWLPPAYQDDPRDAVGHAFIDRGYMSASARGFDQAPPLNPGEDRLLMRVPAGKGALYIDPISLNVGEDEILLSRDTVTYVHDAYQVGGQWFFEVEVVSRAWADAAGVFVHR